MHPTLRKVHIQIYPETKNMKYAIQIDTKIIYSSFYILVGDITEISKISGDAYVHRNAVNIMGTYIDNDYADTPAHDNCHHNAHVSIRVDRRRIIQAAMMYDRDGYVIDKKKSETGKMNTES
ncbi:unnamed protein product [Adineta steineri]|uniref:Uncharacterized protein n=1 Tax=Adineta steineri TaxID=433720 RepID=A0A814LBR5_9BILA|nr:unnamed protein product [Adineta steineri]